MTPRIATSADFPQILRLIRESFAYMDARIDPPSSMHRMSVASIAEQAETGEVWLIDGPRELQACVFLTPQAEALYLGKLAVAAAARGQGLSRRLVALAETRARALGYAALELQTRVELVENHAIFAGMGFHRVAETAHPGYARPTSFTWRKTVSAEALPPAV
ncbi:GNAT family N-acetyltransferase [Haematobacter genomosp. 1]|uniref:GNAT family N-acetyltransferase n=1 Tax=Haematobacter genomosp. 1 TaxID=366618 RepID=A0A212ABU2_9RHOB|nr:GNAT family N-acetyltransferase [Haematobacter genomosp. 1]OWJ78217.1 GNAT family N-acetyltransferase [Haematobacter genomosp. 1]